MFIKLFKKGYLLFLIILIVIIIITIFSINFVFKNKANTVAIYDKTIIIEKVKSLNRLETLEMLIQRDIEITLDLGDFKVLEFSILKNKRTQKIAVTGKIVSGIDFSKLDSNKVSLNQNSSLLKIELPSTEVFYINLMEDKMYILKDDMSLLFNLTNLSTSKRNELNQLFQQQVIKQSKLALLQGACEAGILEKSFIQAKNNVQNLFAFTQIQNFDITFEPEKSCLDTDISSL